MMLEVGGRRDEESDDGDARESDEECDGPGATRLVEQPGVNRRKQYGGASNVGVGAKVHDVARGVRFDRGQAAIADTMLYLGNSPRKSRDHWLARRRETLIPP